MHQINHINLGQKNWVEVDDDARGVYSSNSQIKFKTSVLRSELCDYSDAYFLVKGTKTVPDTTAVWAAGGPK